MENEKPLLTVKHENGYVLFGLFFVLFGFFLIWCSTEEGYVQFSSGSFIAGLIFASLQILITIMTFVFPKRKIYFYNDRIEVDNTNENLKIYYKEIECWKKYKYGKYSGVEIYTKDKFLVLKGDDYNNTSKIQSLLTESNLPFDVNLHTEKRIKINTDKNVPKWIFGIAMTFLICLFFSIFIFLSVKTKKNNAISKEKITLNTRLSENAGVRIFHHSKSGRKDTFVELKIVNSNNIFVTEDNIFSVEQLDYIFNLMEKNEQISLQILKVDYEYRIAKTKKPTFWYNHFRLGEIYIYGLKHKDKILVPFEK